MDDGNELRFGVVDDVLYGLKSPPVPGAQWTGVVTGIAVQMLESGAVDAVVCVQSDPNDRWACMQLLLDINTKFAFV
jgi:7-hydroxymethyl chlorophyll a reductase